VRGLRRFGILALAAVAVACGTSTSSPSSTQRPAASAVPTSTAGTSATGSSATGGPAAGQTDTDWGRIWDTLPSRFPTVPGSTPGDETATGPATANLVVDGLDAKGITTLLQTLLTQGGYQTVGYSGPLENGAFVLDMTGSPAGCRLQVTATPTGSLTALTILYGAACPHD
jgi:hypothetical protein